MRTVDDSAAETDLDGDEAAEELVLDGVAAAQFGVVTALLGGILSFGALLEDWAGDGSSGEGGNSDDVLGKHFDFGWWLRIGNPVECLES